MPASRVSLPRRAVLLVALCAALCVTALTLSGFTTRADHWWYELLLAQSRDRADHAADTDIVIVAIDDRSLDALGRWPWPRRTHADLVERLAQARARGVMLDILFSEPDHADPAGDVALAKAIADNGRVALPVTATAVGPGGPPIELLPMPALACAAAALGHVEVVVDDDGVARRAHLRAGLGDAHWPALALALIEAGGGDAAASTVGLQAGKEQARAPHLWHRDREIMIPYHARRTFAEVSYVDVLRGEVGDPLLKGRWILVGVTAPGIGDTIQTPMPSGHARIPGVVYQAHLLDTLLHGETITALGTPLRIAIGTLLVLLPAWLLLRGLSHRAWWVASAGALATLVTSAVLLYGARSWFPPMPALFAMLAGAAAWVLYRMRQSQRHAHYDTLTRLANRRLFDDTLRRELNAGDRRASPLSLLLIDVDHFKHYNDTYGHQAGDDMLRQVARAIAVHARRGRDLPARYGGDELAVILPGIDASAAQEIADAIVTGVRALAIPHAGSEIADTVTVSIGVAEVRSQHERRAKILVERADVALYRAKQLGRNCSYRAQGADG